MTMRVSVSFEGGLDSIVIGESRQLRFIFEDGGSSAAPPEASSSKPALRLFHLVAFLSKAFVTKPALFSRPYSIQDVQLRILQSDAKAKAQGEAVMCSEEELLRQVQSGEEMKFPLSSLLPDEAALAGGILCLVNDIDFEVLESLETPIRDGDSVTFISTLHGG